MGAYHKGEAHLSLAFADEHDIPDEDIELFRSYSGDAATAQFFLQAASTCRGVVPEPLLTRGHSKPDDQCMWIVMTPTVKEFVGKLLTKREGGE